MPCKYEHGKIKSVGLTTLQIVKSRVPIYLNLNKGAVCGIRVNYLYHLAYLQYLFIYIYLFIMDGLIG